MQALGRTRLGRRGREPGRESASMHGVTAAHLRPTGLDHAGLLCLRTTAKPVSQIGHVHQQRKAGTKPLPLLLPWINRPGQTRRGPWPRLARSFRSARSFADRTMDRGDQCKITGLRIGRHLADLRSVRPLYAQYAHRPLPSSPPNCFPGRASIQSATPPRIDHPRASTIIPPHHGPPPPALAAPAARAGALLPLGLDAPARALDPDHAAGQPSRGQ